eukprot:6172265-Pleurochrysis_carterae.AAC.2
MVAAKVALHHLRLNTLRRRRTWKARWKMEFVSKLGFQLGWESNCRVRTRRCGIARLRVNADKLTHSCKQRTRLKSCAGAAQTPCVRNDETVDGISTRSARFSTRASGCLAHARAACDCGAAHATWACRRLQTCSRGTGDM